MIKIKRSIMSDVLGLTNNKKDFFEVNDKTRWCKLAFKVSHLHANRTIDLWKNSDGSTRPIFSPSDEYLREKFKDEIDAVTKKGTFKVSVPVTVIYPNGETMSEERTLSFDTYEEMKKYVLNDVKISRMPSMTYYPFMTWDPVEIIKKTVHNSELTNLGGDFNGDPDIRHISSKRLSM